MLRALACLFALDVSASRQNLGTERKRSATVEETVGALVQAGRTGQDAAAFAKAMSALQVTPEAMDNLREALQSVVVDLEENVETKIKDGFEFTQETITHRIDLLTQCTADALQDKGSADSSDSIWISCVGLEKSKLEAVEAAETALQVAENSKVLPCAQQLERAPFGYEPTLNFAFACDFMNGNCDEALKNYNLQVNDMLSTLAADMAAASASYDDAKGRCDAAKADVAAKTVALEAANSAYSAQKVSCLTGHEARQLSICAFGNSYQRKCSDVDAYTWLMSDIDQVNGNQHSQPDREAEWETTYVTKCMLNVVINGDDITDSVLDTCTSAVNFATQVGQLDRMKDEFDQQTTPENFSCQETVITFSGETWEIPSGANPKSSDYKKVPYHPAVSRMGSPFSFC